MHIRAISFTGCRVTLSAYFGQAPFSPKEKKKKEKKTQHAVTGVHNQALVRQSCSRNNVVESVGKTSLVLNTIFWTRPREGVNRTDSLTWRRWNFAHNFLRHRRCIHELSLRRRSWWIALSCQWWSLWRYSQAWNGGALSVGIYSVHPRKVWKWRSQFGKWTDTNCVSLQVIRCRPMKLSALLANFTL